MQKMLITDEAAWLEKKKSYVTSTEAAALFGVQAKYVPTAFELWHIKKGTVPPRTVEGDFILFGKLVEETVVKMINAKHPDWQISPFPYFFHDDEDKIGSSFDREMVISGRRWLLEIKSISYGKYKEDFIEHSADDIEASPQYEVQMQVELECADDFEGCVMAIFIADTRQLKFIFRKREREVGSAIRKAVREFWQMKEPPPLDYAKDKSVLAKVMPSCDPDLKLDMTTNNRATELVSIYKNSKDLIKQEEANADAAYCELMEILGRAKFAFTNYHRVTVSDIKPNEGTLITAEMAGQRYGERDGYKRLTITPIQKKDKTP